MGDGGEGDLFEGGVLAIWSLGVKAKASGGWARDDPWLFLGPGRSIDIGISRRRGNADGDFVVRRIIARHAAPQSVNRDATKDGDIWHQREGGAIGSSDGVSCPAVWGRGVGGRR